MIVKKAHPRQAAELASRAKSSKLSNVNATLVFAVDEKLLREIVACTSANVLSLKPQNNLSKQALRKSLLLAALPSRKNEAL